MKTNLKVGFFFFVAMVCLPVIVYGQANKLINIDYYSEVGQKTFIIEVWDANETTLYYQGSKTVPSGSRIPQTITVPTNMFNSYMIKGKDTYSGKTTSYRLNFDYLHTAEAYLAVVYDYGVYYPFRIVDAEKYFNPGIPQLPEEIPVI